MDKHDCIEELHEVELKATPARLAVLQYLENEKTPLDAESIYDHLKAEHDAADKATIYRILETFYQKGLITRIDLQEGKFRYGKAGDAHHHLICDSCGKIEDISDCNIKELEKDIKKKKQFIVKRHSLEFFGICTSCQK